MIKVAPESKLGTWTGGFLAGSVAAFVVMQVLVALGQTGGDTLMDNPLLGLTGIIGALCAIAMLVTGVDAVVHKDRSAVVFVAVVLGALSAWFLIGEIVVPH